MKSINGIFAAILVFASTLTAQATYPLQVGNLWQYWTYEYLNGQYTWYYGWTTRVVGDSLMPDGQMYARLQSDGLYGLNGFVRQENSKVLTYSASPYGTKVLYDFSKSPYDTMFVFPRPVHKDSLIQVVLRLEYVTVFGAPKLQWTYYLFSTRTSYDQTDLVTDGYGLITLKHEGGDEWFLRGAIIDGIKYGTITSVPQALPRQLPDELIIYPNFPNPFNSETTISFSLPADGEIQIDIYDIVGRAVRTLSAIRMQSGDHSIRWDARDDGGQDAASGLYVCSIRTQHFVKRHKMLLIR